jgi:glycosyltransferase involved in cell wall biosynthesis
MTTRVLHPITRLIVGGAQENTLLTAELLNKDHWDVDVICGPQTGSEGSLIESAQDRGISLSIEPTLVREINPVKDLQALVALTRLIRRKRYTIVHTHSSKAGILGRWAAWLARTPVIVHTVHGWGHNDRQRATVRALFILLERLSLRITDRLIAVTPLNVSKGITDGIGREDDYIVVRSGIELDRFGHPQVNAVEVRASLGISPNAPVVGTVTRLSPQKAPADFIHAAAHINENHPDVRFVIVGDGPLRAEAEELAANLGLTGIIHFTGLRRDVPELMAAFDIFALSSLWEGLPRVLPQAMATGLPIVATNIDGNAEAVEHGVNGFLVPTNDPQAIAGAVEQLLENPDLAKRMGEVGRVRVQEFGDRRMVGQLEDLYSELMEEKLTS